MCRRAGLWWAALILVLLAAGCAKPGSQKDVVPERQAVELTVGIMRHSREPISSVISDFERIYPHVRIHTKAIDVLTPTNEVDKAALEGVDLVYGTSGMAARLHKADLLLDLSALPVPSLDPAVADLVEGHAFMSGQRVWLPFSLQPVLMQVRPGDLTRHGIPIPDPNWTYADFEETLQRLYDAGYPGQFFQVVRLRHDVVRAFGGGDYDAATGRWHFNTPENQQAYAYLARLVQRKLITAEPMTHGASTPKPIDYTSTLFSSGAASQVIAPPVGTAGRKTQILADGLMVLNAAQHREEALAFIRFMLTADAQRRLASENVRPIIADEVAHQRWRQAVGPDSVGVMDVAFASGYVVNIPAGVSFYEDIYRMVTGQVGIEETLTALDARLNQ